MNSLLPQTRLRHPQNQTPSALPCRLSHQSATGWMTRPRPTHRPDPLLLDISVTVRGHFSTGSMVSSLASQWGPRQQVHQCLNGVVLGVDLRTGDTLGARCRKNDCLYCARGKVARITAAVRYSQPTHLLTFTALTGNYHADANKINRLTKYIRRDGRSISLVWAAEPNPAGTGTHAHAWAYGDDIGGSYLNSRAADVGIGLSHVKVLTGYANLGYLTKSAVWNEASLASYRGLNGTSLVHGRTFWRDPVRGTSLTLLDASRAQRSTESTSTPRRTS